MKDPALEPQFDADGYPTEEFLARLEAAQADEAEDALRAIAQAWRYPEMVRRRPSGLWVFATGGWSGNESLINSFLQSLAGAVSPHLSVRGGLWLIAPCPTAKKDLEDLEQYITTLAWGK